MHADTHGPQLDAEAVLAKARRDEGLAFAFKLLDFNHNGFVALKDFNVLIHRLQVSVRVGRRGRDRGRGRGRGRGRMEGEGEGGG